MLSSSFLAISSKDFTLSQFLCWVAKQMLQQIFLWSKQKNFQDFVHMNRTRFIHFKRLHICMGGDTWHRVHVIVSFTLMWIVVALIAHAFLSIFTKICCYVFFVGILTRLTKYFLGFGIVWYTVKKRRYQIIVWQLLWPFYTRQVCKASLQSAKRTPKESSVFLLGCCLLYLYIALNAKFAKCM